MARREGGIHEVAYSVVREGAEKKGENLTQNGPSKDLVREG